MSKAREMNIAIVLLFLLNYCGTSCRDAQSYRGGLQKVKRVKDHCITNGNGLKSHQYLLKKRMRMEESPKGKP